MRMSNKNVLQTVRGEQETQETMEYLFHSVETPLPKRVVMNAGSVSRVVMPTDELHWTRL
jgi:hypothetical protein